MLGLVIAVFGIIQGLLTLRMVLPLFGGVPEQLQPLMPGFLQVTDLLMAPFAFIELPGVGGFPGFGAGQIDTAVLPALIGWSVVELVIVGGLRLLGRGRSRREGDNWESA